MWTHFSNLEGVASPSIHGLLVAATTYGLVKVFGFKAVQLGWKRLYYPDCYLILTGASDLVNEKYIVSMRVFSTSSRPAMSSYVMSASTIKELVIASNPDPLQLARVFNCRLPWVGGRTEQSSP